MRYVIVTEERTITSQPFATYDEALTEAGNSYGDDVQVWFKLNLRIEEIR